MTETDARLWPSSVRAQHLIEAWNRRDVQFILDHFADQIRLEAHSPKFPPSLQSIQIATKDDLAAALAAYRALHSRFTIISASEGENVILLTLEDAEGDVLIISLGIDDGGLVDSITSYRAQHPDIG